jgi:diguanylate cyclase (GGDEF)-like protein
MTILESRQIRLFILVMISIATICWQYFGMNHSLVITPSKNSDIYLRTDSINGGKSVAELTIEQGRATLDCEVRDSTTFGFCSIMIPLPTEANTTGIDLSQYDTIDVKLSFQSNLKDTVLFYLLSQNNTKDKIVTRTNLHTINPKKGESSYRLHLDRFFVPSWWLFSTAGKQGDSAPSLDNIAAIQVSTGDNTQERKVQLAVGSIVFRGKWISTQNLYLLLLVGWMLVLIWQGVTDFLKIRHKYQHSQQRSNELKNLNHFLSIQRDKFETMAKHDVLTGCLNRAGLRPYLLEQVASSSNNKADSALLMIDVDYFKNINDQFGHDVGDEVLVNLALYLRKHLRSEDHLCRWGGEEFVVICPKTDLYGAQALAEKLRQGIQQKKLCAASTITCSFGVAQLNTEDIETWFKAADEALYTAKSMGRNRVQIAF